MKPKKQFKKWKQVSDTQEPLLKNEDDELLEKCEKCGLRHIEEESCDSAKERLDRLLKLLDVMRSGYGGVMPNGNIVDRREHPEATPIQKNDLFGTPKPLPIA